ncbi:hypothetical protein OCOJLMKI_1973 [Methylobacterium iners]|uniref:Uncharacterized protein n=1 Tax=Methylobacterium iners TaxID=418707 RepID=A0ABQ4RYK5_9HYPH|nr:hypothetical protein OCOJLMKI_1973 [Methylobacterium iners]
MYTARARQAEELWVELPEPNLDRYLLRSRPRAANDNLRLSSVGIRAVQFSACVALVSVLSLVSALVQ